MQVFLADRESSSCGGLGRPDPHNLRFPAQKAEDLQETRSLSKYHVSRNVLLRSVRAVKDNRKRSWCCQHRRIEVTCDAGMQVNCTRPTPPPPARHKDGAGQHLFLLFLKPFRVSSRPRRSKAFDTQFGRNRKANANVGWAFFGYL